MSLRVFSFSQTVLLCLTPNALKQQVTSYISSSFIAIYDRLFHLPKEEVILLDFYNLLFCFYKNFKFFIVLQSKLSYDLHSQFRDLISHLFAKLSHPQLLKDFPCHMSEQLSETGVSCPYTPTPSVSLLVSAPRARCQSFSSATSSTLFTSKHELQKFLKLLNNLSAVIICV